MPFPVRLATITHSPPLSKGLVTNYGGGGGYKTGGGGGSTKRGGGKRFSHAEGEGGHQKLWGSCVHSSLNF